MLLSGESGFRKRSSKSASNEKIAGGFRHRLLGANSIQRRDPAYRRGLSTITLSGGKVISTLQGRPWAMWSVAMTPGPLPMLLPP
jgi:hypothetical protein